MHKYVLLRNCWQTCWQSSLCKAIAASRVILEPKLIKCGLWHSYLEHDSSSSSFHLHFVVVLFLFLFMMYIITHLLLYCSCQAHTFICMLPRVLECFFFLLCLSCVCCHIFVHWSLLGWQHKSFMACMHVHTLAFILRSSSYICSSSILLG